MSEPNTFEQDKKIAAAEKQAEVQTGNERHCIHTPPKLYHGLTPPPGTVFPKTTNPGMNPKDAVGTRKAGMSAISGPVMFELGLAMLEGARKYGRHNWRVSGVRFSVYFDATLRHMFQWWEGEDIDPECDVHHVTKAIACLMVLRDSMLAANAVDDRPPMTAPDKWMERSHARAGDIIDRHPDAKPAHIKGEEK